MRINIMEIPVHSLYDASALKKPANVSVNADLLLKAKSLDINLSATLEAALAAEVKRRRAEQWLKDNKPSLDAYNKLLRSTACSATGCAASEQLNYRKVIYC